MSITERWARWKIKKAQYPKGWRRISRECRERANNTCQHCGARHRWFHPITGSIVFIQAAHLDHDRTNCEPSNLAALCQRCHLIYDAPLHAIEAYKTRREGKALKDLFA